jgi:hypothetical protein
LAYRRSTSSQGNRAGSGYLLARGMPQPLIEDNLVLVRAGHLSSTLCPVTKGGEGRSHSPLGSRHEAADPEKQNMRKSIIDRSAWRVSPFEQECLEIEDLAKIEVTSEDPNFPIESALSPKMGQGWRAAEKGSQIIRIIFDEPRSLQRIRLEFCETGVERTQEFILRWSRTKEKQHSSIHPY